MDAVQSCDGVTLVLFSECILRQAGLLTMEVLHQHQLLIQIVAGILNAQMAISLFTAEIFQPSSPSEISKRLLRISIASWGHYHILTKVRYPT